MSFPASEKSFACSRHSEKNTSKSINKLKFHIYIQGNQDDIYDVFSLKGGVRQ